MSLRCAALLHAACAPPSASWLRARVCPAPHASLSRRRGALPGRMLCADAAAAQAQAAHDEARMRQCLELARTAAAAGEVPVGALLEHDGRVLAVAHNCSEAQVRRLLAQSPLRRTPDTRSRRRRSMTRRRTRSCCVCAPHAPRCAGGTSCRVRRCT
jgi:hypothetical protein